MTFLMVENIVFGQNFTNTNQRNASIGTVNSNEPMFSFRFRIAKTQNHSQKIRLFPKTMKTIVQTKVTEHRTFTANALQAFNWLGWQQSMQCLCYNKNDCCCRRSLVTVEFQRYANETMLYNIVVKLRNCCMYVYCVCVSTCVSVVDNCQAIFEPSLIWYSISNFAFLLDFDILYLFKGEKAFYSFRFKIWRRFAISEEAILI